jgi:SAM-dependent methyltransferase
MAEPDETIAAYSHGVAEFAARFESADSEDLWSSVREFIPQGGKRVGVDVGAGVGRDAAWLMSLGLEMVAVEPAEGMRAFGETHHPDLRWLDDRLPDLAKVHRLGLTFDLVLLSAVWQHLAPAERPRAFRKLVTLLKPGGVLIMSLRHGPGAAGRAWHQVPLGEVEGLAREFGLAMLRAVGVPDSLGREGVEWTLVVLRLPDDGSVGRPAAGAARL